MKFYDDGTPVIPRAVMTLIGSHVKYMHDDQAIGFLKSVLDEEIKTFGVTGSHPHILFLATRISESLVGERHIPAEFARKARQELMSYTDQLAPQLQQPQLAVGM